MENQDKFQYTYSAKEQEEIRAICRKYTEPTEDAMTLLRRLDAGVTKKATAVALSFGSVGALLLGSGMSLIMTEIGAEMGLSYVWSMIVGAPIGVVGILLACAAYPLYHYTLVRERKKIAPTVLRLSEELMK